ncbi:hypothetical protein PAPYR_7575 [Paratrimastix pyriformis]|uniref:Uncharacterized protein n=1 Tax=Paratrimastix pyriformis TaxID=342808 RepID=A0ABQ8UDV0_9EUKA|nr:hypothetical protein PAPYR_9514 [Paratrimastix pyriformis]KAJ4457066.1 hypothetical protein PAPYR_7575 [Paratrimastix pyriformis]
MSDENYCNATPYCFKTIMRSLQKVKSKIQDFDKQYQTMVDDAAQSLTFLKTINYEGYSQLKDYTKIHLERLNKSQLDDTNGEIIIQWSSLFNKFSDSLKLSYVKDDASLVRKYDLGITFIRHVAAALHNNRIRIPYLLTDNDIVNSKQDRNDLHTLDIRENLELNKFFEEN